MRRLWFHGLAIAVVMASTVRAQGPLISQIYGAGGAPGAPFDRDYVELYNPSGAAISLAGWSVQYTSARGTGSWVVTPLGGTIGPGRYYLVGEGATPGSAPTLPAVDANGTIAMSPTDGKVALCSTTTPLFGATPAGGSIVDLVGYGTLANYREPTTGGNAAKNAPVIGSGLAEHRRSCGATDTNDNAADFVAGFPSPRNSAVSQNLGLGASGFALPNVVLEGQSTRIVVAPRACGTDGPVALLTVDADLTGIGGIAAQPLYDDGMNGDEAAGDGLWSFATLVLPGTTPGTKIIPVSFTASAASGGSSVAILVTAASAPANDHCSGAVAIAGPYAPQVTVPVVMTGAMPESNAVFSAPGFATGAEPAGMSNRRGRWYTVTGTGSAMTASTCATNPPVDTVVNVMCGTCDGFSVVATSDDAGFATCPTNISASSATWCSGAGQTYYVWVAPFTPAPSTATIALSIVDGGAPCGSVVTCATCPAPPTSGATVETERPLGPGIDDGCDTTAHGFQDVSPVTQTIVGTSGSYYDAADPDWYRFQSQVRTVLSATLTAQFQGSVSIHQLGPTGQCTGSPPLATSGPSARCGSVSVSRVVEVGLWYAVRIVHAPAAGTSGGTVPGGAGAHYALGLLFGAAPDNDACSAAFPLLVGTGYTVGSTNGASNDGSATCDATGRDVWYLLTNPVAQTVTIDTCTSAIDTVLAVFPACGGAEMACDDDCQSACTPTASCVTLVDLPCGTWLIRVSDKGIGAGGSFSIRAQGSFTLTNDSCATAIPVACPSITCGATTGAAPEPALPPGCIGPAAPGLVQDFSYTASVWYSVTPTTSGTITASTQPSPLDTRIWVWTGSCGALTCVTANDDIAGTHESKVAWNATAGQEYFVMVGHFGAVGPFTLEISTAAPPANDQCAAASALSPPEAGTIAGTTAGATPELLTSTTAYPACAANGGIFDVWFAYTACATGSMLTLDTCGLYDTTVSVHGACPSPAGPSHQITGACNDDGPGACAPGSRLTVTGLVSGTTYLIRVSGAAGANPGGTFTLSWIASGLPVWFDDDDGDGFGDPASALHACMPPQGWVSNGQDCDDSNPAIKPGATETCDGIDNDCDGLTDDADPGVVGQLVWFQDSDGDGFGNLAVTQPGCVQPPGYVSNSTDCNDANAAMYPGATEVCDGVDNDCNSLTDDADPGVVGQATWHQDSDADGYGNPAVTQIACAQPSGWVADNTDCNDGNAAVNPGALEICNGTDDDCDGTTDEGCPSNDTCAGAIQVAEGIVSGDNALAFGEISDVTCGPTSNDVWFRYTNASACAETVTASLCAADGGSASFDSVLHVFLGTCGSLVLAACSDDVCGSASSVVVSLAAGESAYVAVSAAGSGAGGPFALAVSSTVAAATQIGPGCSADGGPGPTLAIDGPPVFGTTRVMLLTGAAPNSGGVLFVSPPSPIVLPFNGCPVYLSAGEVSIFSLIATDGSGTWGFVAPIPVAPWLECQGVTFQAFVSPPAIPFQLSSGLGLVLGS